MTNHGFIKSILLLQTHSEVLTSTVVNFVV